VDEFMSKPIRKIAPFKKSNYLSQPKQSGYLGAIDESLKLKEFAEARGTVGVYTASIHAKRGYLMKEGDEVALYLDGDYGNDSSDDGLRAEATKIESDFILDGFYDGLNFKVVDAIYLDKDLTPLDFIARREVVDKLISASDSLKSMPIYFVNDDEILAKAESVGENFDYRIYAKSAVGAYLKEDPNFIQFTPTIALDLLVEKKDGKVFKLSIMDGAVTRIVAELTTDENIMVGKSVKVAASLWNSEKSQFQDSIYLGASDAPMGIDELVEKILGLRKSKIFKMDEEKHLVYGVVLQPDVADLQGDIMSAEDIEKTAHNFMRKSRAIRFGHEREEKATPVESYIARKDFKMVDETITTGSWVLGVHVENDDTWQKIKSGDINSFSIGGTGTREPLDG